MGGDGPRATPTIVANRVYADGATGILDCLDTASGQLIWTHDTLRENGIPNNHFGQCSSPLVASNLEIVSICDDKQPDLAGLSLPRWIVGLAKRR